MRHIENKQEFYSMSRKLLLGNILKQWTWDEFREQYYNRLRGQEHELPTNNIVGVRHIRKAFTNKGNSGLMQIDTAFVYGQQTPYKEDLIYDEGAIHDRLTIQGEVTATERGLYVRYSHLQCHQRTLWYIDVHGLRGLKPWQLPHNREILTANNGVVKHAFGLCASALLQKYMDDPSWDMLNQILGCQLGDGNSFGDQARNFMYPIVEFACFRCPIGVLGWNTLFWEVRTKY